MLRVHSWEPVQLLDTIEIGWKNVIDMTIHKDQLVRSHCLITMYIVQLINFCYFS